MIRPARMLLILPAALALALASCGRKGSLAPPGTKKQLPIDWLLN